MASSNIVLFMLFTIVSFSFQLSQATRQLPKYHHYDHSHPIHPRPRPSPTPNNTPLSSSLSPFPSPSPSPSAPLPLPPSPSPAPEPSAGKATKFLHKWPITIISSTPVLPLWKNFNFPEIPKEIPSEGVFPKFPPPSN
ncbi:hypothetical protein M9H77_19622 [Catharanthus roseus]|uniref:Uncharacterized protein n=1 Tax=Catharanthus roseus TaxID=4058 RepID=A0ACC0BAS4_CATRO|nr:hypothetical protein M9H77_19622 [Catharanthus roseus]